MTSESHHLNNLPTNKLAVAAAAEAKAFALPSDWREGRAVIDGYAIDAPYVLDVDDAVGLSNGESGSELRVSVADTGSFLHSQVAISKYARRNLQTRYSGTRVLFPMIPREVSQDALSLVHGSARPVLTIHMPVDNLWGTVPRISRDVIHTSRVDYAEVDRLIAADDTNGVAFRGLAKIARHLFAARHRESSSDLPFVFDTEEGELRDTQDSTTGHLIVGEAMIAANAAMARFMRHHNIPALYRNHTLPEFSEVDPNDWALQMLLARASYDTQPKGHVGLRLDAQNPYAHGTSPLRRFSDFANHANVAAFLDERPYPYPEDRLGRIADRMRAIALRDIQYYGARQQAQHPLSPRQKKEYGPTISPYRRPSYLIEKFNDNTAGPGEIATALFGAEGTPEDVQAVRVRAAQYAAQNIHHAQSALKVALDRGYLRLYVNEAGEVQENQLQTRDGVSYMHNFRSGNAVTRAVRVARLLGTIAGTAVEPVIPANRTREGRIRAKPHMYLLKLEREQRIHVGGLWSRETDEGVQSNITVRIGDASHTVAATGATKKQARAAAAWELIEKLDLLQNPPAPSSPSRPNSSPQIARLAKEEMHKNPIVALTARQQTASLTPAAYEFIPAENGDMECRIVVTDIDGATYGAVGRGPSKKEAKQHAAAGVLAKLPPRPLNKKGDMYQG